MQVIAHIDGRVRFKCFRGQGGNWIGVCDPLKLTVQSATYAELMEDIASTLDALLKDLLSTNELAPFLRQHGWRMAGKMPSSPQDVERFDVPFIPSVMTKHGQSTALH